MIRRRTLASLLAVGILGVGAIAAGCGEDDSGSGADVGELKVGVLVPLTGDLADLGGPGAKAAELAAAQVNAAAEGADSGLSLRLVTEDTRTDPEAAQEAAAKVIESKGVSAIAGPWGAPELIPTAENVTIPGGVPLVTPSVTDPDLTDLDDDGLVFRTAPSDAIQGRVIATLMSQALGDSATVNTANRDDAYGRALAHSFTEAWEAAGGTVATNVSFDPEAARLNSEARQIAQGDPDGWMIIDDAGTWARMGPALVRTGNWDPARTFTGDGLRSPDLPSDAGRASTEGMRGSVPTSLEAPAGEQFDALWRSQVKQPRQTYDVQSFDAVILIALAAAAGGSSDPAAIAANLGPVSGPPGTKYTFEHLQEALDAAANGDDIDYEGASGPIDLDENGDPTAANYHTWAYANGELADSDQVIRVTSD